MSEASVRRLLAAVTTVGGDLSAPEVLRRLVRSAVELTGADHGAFVAHGAEHGLPPLVAEGGDDPPRDRLRDGLGRLLDERPGPRRLTDVREHPVGPALAPLRSLLVVPVRGRGTVFGHVCLGDERASRFGQDDEDSVGVLAAAAATALRHAARLERTALRSRWLEAAHEVTTALLSGEDPSAALHLIAERAREVSGASVGAIARPSSGDEVRLVFDIVETTDSTAERVTGLSVSAHGTATGEAFSTGKPVVVRDYGRRAADYQRDSAGVRVPPPVADLDSAVAVPLTVGSATLGVLLVAKVNDKVPFSDEDVRLVQTFAGQAALALEFARAGEDRQRLAVFEDRERIAHDLHDLVIQRLFAIGLGLEALGRLTTDPRTSGQVSGFVTDLDRTIRDIRNSIFSLQEPAEAPGSLRSELLRVALDHAPALGFEPRIGFEGPLDTAVPEVVRPDLLAALREGLANAARHARATSVAVEVSVDRSGHTVTLTVTDDGAGVPEDLPPRDGLRELAGRAARWSGTSSVRPAPGRGTKLEWTARLPRSGE
ncbi:sensor histidine kinase [Prauserella endophytica]|uniref:GAF domain-containing protein n=1 Tax=Prauserella endophytica TaxID=1592324 RepID=A0ABY2S5M2_9PSEU|nr:GAF domain-containing protein [Prauserella endophytica]TKG71180.1 GAF domain-containing protein [Prauserella endophytica]